MLTTFSNPIFNADERALRPTGAKAVAVARSEARIAVANMIASQKKLKQER